MGLIFQEKYLFAIPDIVAFKNWESVTSVIYVVDDYQYMAFFFVGDLDINPKSHNHVKAISSPCNYFSFLLVLFLWSKSGIFVEQ